MTLRTQTVTDMYNCVENTAFMGHIIRQAGAVKHTHVKNRLIPFKDAYADSLYQHKETGASSAVNDSTTTHYRSDISG